MRKSGQGCEGVAARFQFSRRHLRLDPISLDLLVDLVSLQDLEDADLLPLLLELCLQQQRESSR